MSFGLLSLGFLLGMRHALETDHVAAVASLATRSASVRETIRQGAVWGLGHTLTLFAFGSVVLLMDTVMPQRLAQGLELAVGVMLVGLGIDVLRRVIRERIHFHVHRHDDGVRHFHAHSHAGERGHPELHHHQHVRGFPLRALFVGLMHGMAGSAALILLTLQTVQSPLTGLLYIALFGIGSIAGMAALSAIIAVPLRYSARGLTWLHNGLQLGIGAMTLAIGALVVYRIGFVDGLLV
ncbi:MAG TPA: urease accessory protein [Gammaproteobacteria bacterium]|nr:urease accessory protein [Gammaproteobacteria bacterium]